MKIAKTLIIIFIMAAAASHGWAAQQEVGQLRTQALQRR